MHIMNGRRGWALVLLVFVLGAFAAVLPLIATNLQTSSQTSTAYEKWAEWQRQKEADLLEPTPTTTATPGGFDTEQEWVITKQAEEP